MHILKIHPAIRPERLASLPDSGLQALIIEAFGSGNFPIAGPHNLLPVFRACADAGMHLIIASQAPYDAIQLHKYESGRQAEALGMISAGDMIGRARPHQIHVPVGASGSLSRLPVRLPHPALRRTELTP